MAGGRTGSPWELAGQMEVCWEVGSSDLLSRACLPGPGHRAQRFCLDFREETAGPVSLTNSDCTGLAGPAPPWFTR